MLTRLKAATRTLLSTLNPRTDLVLENLALRQQLALVCHKATQRARPRRLDRIFWVVLSKVWPRWKTALVIVKPNTVVAWQRQGFRLFWRWKSRRRTGRPPIDKQTRALIQEMYTANVGYVKPPDMLSQPDPAASTP